MNSHDECDTGRALGKISACVTGALDDAKRINLTAGNSEVNQIRLDYIITLLERAEATYQEYQS